MHRIVLMTQKDKVVAYFKILSQNSTGETNKNHEKCHSEYCTSGIHICIATALSSFRQNARHLNQISYNSTEI